MSVKTSVSSTAQSLSTRPGMLSGPGALRALILLRDLLTLFGDSVITWSLGGGGVFCAVVLFCALFTPIWKWSHKEQYSISINVSNSEREGLNK